MQTAQGTRRICAALAFALTLLSSSGCTASKSFPEGPTTSNGTTSKPAPDSDISPHSVGGKLDFECGNPIAAGPTAEELGGRQTKLGVPGVMAISAGTPSQMVQFGGGATYLGLQFAKVGLLLKAGTAFTLSVPASMRGAMKIGWSNSGYTLADELVIPGCGSNQAGRDWLAYPGGFWLKEGGCVPLEVTYGPRKQTIHIPVGSPCR